MAAEKDPLGRGWIIAGALLLLIIGGILAGLLIPRSEDPAPPPGTTPPPTSTPSSQTPTATTPENEPPKTAGACTADLNNDQDFPSTAPETTWDQHPTGMVVPTSDDFGPAVREGGFWHCHPRSPTGALFAGANLLASFSAGEIEAAVEGPVREEQIRYQSGGADFQPPLIEGYRVLMSTQDRALIEYDVRQEGIRAALRVPLTWNVESNDWQLDTETSIPTAEQVEDSSVFTRWR